MTRDGLCPPVYGRGFLPRPIACTGLDLGVSCQPVHRYLRRRLSKPRDEGSASSRFDLPSNNCMNLAGLVRHGVCRAPAAPAYACRLCWR